MSTTIPEEANLLSDQPGRRFSIAEIHSATRNFDEALVIGKGGFGTVYKASLDENSTSFVAIKRLDPKSNQGAPEFWTEVEMLSKVRHCHLVSLIGYCNDSPEMVLVYEYMPHGSLHDHLHMNRKPLSWGQRLKICVGAARALEYLHTGICTQHRIIHRDVKSSNILLDEKWAAKISDFGLSKMSLTDQTFSYVSTKVKGSFGYLDPEYFYTGRLTRKSDVYSFGVVLFEVLCGKRAVHSSSDGKPRSLAKWALECVKENNLHVLIDPSLRGQILMDCLKQFAQIASQCLNSNRKNRPTMAKVVFILEHIIASQEKLDFFVADGGTSSTSLDFGNQEIAEGEISNIESKDPSLFVLSSVDTVWWEFHLKLNSRRELPILPAADPIFTFGEKESISAGTHLLVSGQEPEGYVIWRYELVKNKWYRGPSMINPRCLFASATCGISCFVAGGCGMRGGVAMDTAEKYNADSRSWDPLPRMHRKRKFCSGCYMDNKFYVIGGESDKREILTCGEYLDETENKWNLIPDMLLGFTRNQSGSPHHVAVVNNELYLLDAHSNQLYVYLKKTNTWKQLGLAPIRADISGGWGVAFKSLGNKLLSAGKSSASSPSNTGLTMYTCCPDPSVDVLKWECIYSGDNLKGNFIYDCSVMQP